MRGGTELAGHFQGLAAVGGGVNLVALALQVVPQGFQQVFLVFYYEYGAVRHLSPCCGTLVFEVAVNHCKSQTTLSISSVRGTL